MFLYQFSKLICFFYIPYPQLNSFNTAFNTKKTFACEDICNLKYLALNNFQKYGIFKSNPVSQFEENVISFDENKYFIGKVLEKFTRALRIRIIRNNEGFVLYHNLGYLEELCHEDGIEPLFPHVVSLKMEL